MAWQTPKTNWINTDYFNVADYERIVGNLKYLKDLLELMYSPVTTEEMTENKTYASMLYASEINAIESNLEVINQGTYSFDLGQTKTYTPNGHTPTYEEFNRIESAILRLKITLESQYENIPKIAFILGNYRGIQI